VLIDDERRKDDDAEDFDDIVREMEKIIEDAFRNSSDIQALSKGYTFKVDGKNQVIRQSEGNWEKIDVVEDGDTLYVTVDLPDAIERDIKVRIKQDAVDIRTPDGTTEVPLPFRVEKQFAQTFKNGVLDLVFSRR
jgi:HSP20 family molecular chaperone IbpA